MIDVYRIYLSPDKSPYNKTYTNFIRHNREFLLIKERSSNYTTVLGIIDVAWCFTKTKLLEKKITHKSFKGTKAKLRF